MKRLRKVTAAEDSGNSKLRESIDSLKEDFDFIISGLEKLDRTGASESNDGLIIAEGLADTFQSIVSEIADKLQ